MQGLFFQLSLHDIGNACKDRFPTIDTDHYFIERYGEYVRLTDYRDEAFLESIRKVLSFFIPNHSGSLAGLRRFITINEEMLAAVRTEL
ncbi:MAG: hypothetical protein AAFN92_10055 [Bacteroidota bacterium]